MGDSPFDKIKQNRHIKVKQYSVTIEFGWVKIFFALTIRELSSIV